MVLPTPLRPARLSFILAIVLVCSLLVGATTARADDAKSIRRFTEALIALSPTVDPAEAKAVAETSHFTARRLQKKWRVVPPANFMNFLIHIGARDRGFCFHWAHDIGAELRKLPLKTLELHWAEAYANMRLEHNVVVVTVRGEPLRTGYIIDGWRAAGRLLWWPVLKDEYPWKNNPAETAWIQNRGTDPLKALDEPVQEADVRNQTTRKSAEHAL